MRILVCDDNNIIVEEIKKYIIDFFKREKCENIEILTYNSGDELLKANISADLAFLDVEMPGISGIHASQQLKKKNKKILIFIITSYNDYLDEAMRYNVFRFISKPIDKQRLFRNLKDALKIYNTVNEKIAIETKTGMHIIYLDDILFIESANKKSYIYTKDNVLESIYNLKYWLEFLDKPGFYNSHRNYIVNMKYVSKFDEFNVYLCNDKYKVFLSKRKYHDFKRNFLFYLESTR